MSDTETPPNTDTTPPPAETGGERPDTGTDTPPQAPGAPMDDATFQARMTNIRDAVDSTRAFMENTATKTDWSDADYQQLMDLAVNSETHLTDANRFKENATETQIQQIDALIADIQAAKELAANRMAEVQALTAARELERAEADIDADTGEAGPAGDAGTAGETGSTGGEAEPKKSNMEKIADGLGKAFEKLIEFFGKVSEAISNALDKAGVNKKNMLKLFGNVPLIGDVLRSKVQVDDIHAQIEKTFGKGKLLKTDKDSEASNDLKKAFDNETKPAGSTENFEQFVQKRIDAVKATGKTEQITIEDLVNIKPIETKPADAKPDGDKKEEPAKNEKLEKQIQAVKDLGGVEKGDGTWEIPMEADGTLKTVQIKQNPNGTWEWANAGRKPFGRFTPDAAGLTPEFKANQQKLNGLADTLGIPKVAPAPEQYAGTPDQKAKLKELISKDPNVNQNVHMLALAKALRAMGINAISDTDVLEKNILSEKTVNAALKTSLKNFFQYHATKDAGSAQEALGIYWDGDVLKEGYKDNDELDNDIVRGVNLENDPIGFIQALATFEIADGNESATTGYDLNDRAFAKIKILKEKLTGSLAEFTS